MERRDVVVTGAGALAPNGSTREEFWSGVSNGVSGVQDISDRLRDDEEFPVQFAAVVDGYDSDDYFSTKQAKRLDQFVQFGIIAAEEAIEDAGFDLEDPEYDSKRAGVVYGSGVGGLQTLEEQHERFLERGPRRVSPYLVPKF
ncbi:MAG: beta-ketoacyl synthase N-terminal-like domain-containing protein, partial [bacterium]